MSFLVVNGARLSAKDSSVRRKLASKGESGVSVLGVPFNGLRASKRTLTGDIHCKNHETGHAIANLIMGVGHVGSFDGETNLSTSLNMSTDSRAFIAPGDGWSGDALVIESGQTARFAAQIGEEWTVFIRRRDSTSLIWRRLVLRSDGQEFLDEVRLIAGVTNCLSVSSGDLVISGKTLANVNEETMMNF